MKKRTKIVCTIGPASEKTTTLKSMMRAGMNVARLNFSHGTHAGHRKLARNIRSASRQVGVPVAILGDLQGPKIRLGNLPKEGVQLSTGSEFVFDTSTDDYAIGILPVTYKALAKDVKKGHRILIDDGLIEVVVKKVIGSKVHAKVRVGGKVTSHKGMNFPDTNLSISSLTKKDREDVKFAVAEGVDWVALSFVTSPKDVRLLKKLIREAGEHEKVLPRIIVKIEKHEAIDDFEAILKETDGVMVARGDLGVEIPAAEVPVYQKMIIEKCRLAGKPVVVATQMLNSMMYNPRATRAEVSDVANAVFDHTDGVMLSGESATGKYPLKSVQTMTKIIKEAEASPFDDVPLTADRPENREASIAHAIKVLALGGHIDGVLASQELAPWSEMALLAHPELPLYLACPNETARRQQNIRWGCVPFVMSKVERETFIMRAKRVLLNQKKVKKNDRLVVIGVGKGVGLEIIEV